AVLHRPYFHPLRIFMYLGFALVSFFRLLTLFKGLRPQLVHTNNVLILPGAIAARMLRIPHIWHVREIIEGHHIHPFLWRIWRWIILTFSAKVVCISSAVRRQFTDHPKSGAIHDGVDTEFFSPQNSGVRLQNRGGQPQVVGMVGRLEHRRKGQDIFIEAARMALEKKQDLHFVIVGHEREEFAAREGELHEMVERYNLRDKIEFRGYLPREKMPGVLNELDVLVLCSKQPEGLGLVLLEAMSCGKPVIAPAEGGPLDVVEDHRTGLLVPARDAQKLAEAILYLVGHPEEGRKLGEAGRRKVESSFRAEDTAKKTAAIYREVLGIS
ncbi:MAG: glycosyltransferase family 4 protein, partial [Deltaproteobacteria bacterium]|nr:glycosyltransferase family 4 protein [Deltaproteobacteria bacterium]